MFATTNLEGVAEFCWNSFRFLDLLQPTSSAWHWLLFAVTLSSEVRYFIARRHICMSLSDSVDPVPEVTFRSFALSEPLQQAIERSGYTHPTPIQARTIPLLLEGRDVLGQAQTGTGKTAAFALPLLERIDVQVRQPQVLVLTPTRELAIQVAESFEKYAHHLRGLRVVPIYGGQDYQIQFRELDRGVQIVVGTPVV